MEWEEKICSSKTIVQTVCFFVCMYVCMYVTSPCEGQLSRSHSDIVGDLAVLCHSSLSQRLLVTGHVTYCSVCVYVQ